MSVMVGLAVNLIQFKITTVESFTLTFRCICGELSRSIEVGRSTQLWMDDVGCHYICCECVLLQFVTKEAALAYDKAEYTWCERQLNMGGRQSQGRWQQLPDNQVTPWPRGNTGMTRNRSI